MPKSLAVVFNKTTRKAVKITSKYSSKLPADSKLKVQAAHYHGGKEEDYILYKTTDPKIHDRLENGDEFIGVIKEGVVESLDFTNEDKKTFLYVSSSSTAIPYDDTKSLSKQASVKITIEALKADGTVNDSINDTVMLPCLRPGRRHMPVYVTIKNGSATWDYKPDEYGSLLFPSMTDKFVNPKYRIKNNLTIDTYKAI
tara:strand:+ start:893 stop:1489 length:597 start_codon:yes stop_codon:yes gene_type:complete